MSLQLLVKDTCTHIVHVIAKNYQYKAAGYT